MTARLKAKWLTALRGGKYKQIATGRDFRNKDGFCAMGVLEDINGGVLPGLKELSSAHAARIHAMNDAEKKSFREIADYVEANV